MKFLYISILAMVTFYFFTKDQNIKNMETVESILSKEVVKGKTPSVQYVFFNTNSIIFEYQAGYSNLEDSLKADKNTTFNAFSVTKTFTALSILQLVEKGLLALDKPVRHYLPEADLSEEVTIHHLLTHSAGLGNPLPIDWIHLANEHSSFDRDKFFQPVLAKHYKTKRKPGSRFKYSNLGYLVLGQVIEAVSGKTYEQYVTESIINRLKIQPEELSFDIPYKVLHAKGYHNNRSLSMLALGFLLDKSKYMDTGTAKWKPFKQFYVNGAPYGGMIGNLNGFVKYGQALLSDRQDLISNEYKNLLFTENKTTDNKPTGMCLSWFTGTLNGVQYYTHAGGGGGFYVEMRIYPAHGTGSLIVFNRSGMSDERFLDKVDKFFIAQTR